MYRRAKVDPMGFGRTKVNPLKVGELLLIPQCIGDMGFKRTKVNPLKVGELLSIPYCTGELRLILWVSRELRSIL